MAKPPVRARVFYTLDLSNTKSAFMRKRVLRQSFPAAPKAEPKAKRRP
jgi:hypothetical protein